MTKINGLYRILHAFEQTYAMVRNSTKLIAACIVLGVVNQACAVGTVGKAPADEDRAAAGTQVAEHAAKRESSLPVPAGAPEPVTLAADPLKATAAAAPEPRAAAIKPAVAAEPAAAAAPVNSKNSGYGSPARSAAQKPSPAAKDAIVLAQAAAAPHPSSARATSEPVSPPPTSIPAQAIVAAATPAPPLARADSPANAPIATSLAALLSAGSKPTDPASTDTTGTVIPLLAPAKAAELQNTQASSAATATATPVAMQAPAPIPVVYSDTPKDAEPGSLWDRIRAGYAVPEVDSPLVQRHMTWYLNRPEYLERMVERSRRYLHFVVEELEQRGMPLEIALLPMIESAYNPVAYSRAHASGIWQFIPATGKRYGLEQNWWYDGRRDVTAATSAALDYLQKLHNDFGDWQLALAAYNWGEGAVGRAIEKNQRKHKPTDYRSLKMPKETANYLPKLQAVKNIIADPARYGIVLDPIPNQPYFIRVNAPSHIDVKRAAQLAEVPLEEFRNLNPAHNRPVITSDGERMLLLPVEKAEIFANNLQANDDPLVSWQTYTLKPNEKLEQVAGRYGISVNTLKQVNGIGARKRVRSGQTLLVPTPAAMETANLEQSFDPLEFQAPTAGPEMEIYRVKRSDSLQRIANHYQVTQRQIIRWNHLKGGRISVGQQLTIYPDTAPTGKRSTRSKTVKHAEAVKVKKAPAPAVPKKKHLARN